MSHLPLQERWRAFTEPTTDGLPRGRVLAMFLGLIGVVLVVLVGLGVTGSSTGAVHPLISNQPDPDLLAGAPQLVRSDEWLVQTSWVISQVEQGLPSKNENFPGGMDATVQHDLPAADWSTAFRPHLLGFFFLPLDQAMALKWWLPAAAIVASGLLFVLTVLPRRPILGLTFSVALLYSPFVQWWYLSTTLYPVAWALLAMAAIVWCLKSTRRLGAIALSAALAYISVTLAVGVYVPFIVPVVLVVLGFGLGAAFTSTWGPPSFRRRVVQLAPVLLAGVAAAGVLIAWVLTRLETIQSFTSTVYPGERLQAVGKASVDELAGLFSGFLSFGLDRAQGAPFNVNASEASTFFLPGLFLSVLLVWLIVDRARRGHGVDGVSIGVMGVGLVMIAFLVVPHWDVVAHALFVDRTTYARMRIGLGVLSFVIVTLIILRRDERRAFAARPVPLWVILVSAGLAAASEVAVLLRASTIVDVGEVLGHVSPARIAVSVAVGVALVVVVAALAWGRATEAAGLLLAVSLICSGLVNPLYRGVLDLRDTRTVEAVERLAETEPGRWVGIGATVLPAMMLIESGTPAFNGFQSAPPEEMWDQIDPAGTDEAMWNRLANVSWVAGQGDPDPRNPAPDQIQLTFDSCAPFAQDNVTWVLSDGPLDQGCLIPEQTVREGPSTMYIYRVVEGTGD